MKKIDYASLYTLRKDGRYQGYWRDRAGVRHCVCDPDPRRLHERLEDLANGGGVPTFKQAAEEWQHVHVEQLERSTQSTYKAPIEAAIEAMGGLRVDKITPLDIDRVLKAEKIGGLSYKHAATTKSIYKQIFDYAITKGWMDTNPTETVQVPRGMRRGKVQAPSDSMDDQIRRNLDKVNGDMIAVMYYAGLRTEELVALQWRDIDLAAGLICIQRAADLHGTPVIKDTKTEAGERTVPILDELAAHLHRPAGKRASDLVFPADDGKVMSRSKFMTKYMAWCKAAGLAQQITFTKRRRGEKKCTRTEWRPLVSPHQIRHGYATTLVEAGIDVNTIQMWMGHADIATTRKIYVSVRQRFAANQAAQLQAHFTAKSAVKKDGTDPAGTDNP